MSVDQPGAESATSTAEHKPSYQVVTTDRTGRITMVEADTILVRRENGAIQIVDGDTYQVVTTIKPGDPRVKIKARVRAYLETPIETEIGALPPRVQP